MNNFSMIQGNLGKDPEVRQTQNGTRVATYTLACYRANPKDKDKPFTDWYNVAAWGEQADQVTANLKKGMKVLVTGRFQTRSYTDKDGKTVYATDFMQDSFWLAPAKEKPADFAPVAEDEFPF